MERLDKLIASTGYYSRREVKALIRRGLVLVDGVPARSAEQKTDGEAAEIQVNGRTLTCRRCTYLMMHKPGGVLSATEDRRQQTVLDLLPPHLRRIGLFPVGRLDKDTEGLLLLTNDGGLAHRLLAPKSHVDKVYLARVDVPLTEEDAEAFARGVPIGENQVCLPAKLEIGGDSRLGFVTLHEGKFHQIKRMFLSRGKTVLSLRRIAMGTLRLGGDLGEGEYRYLSEQEIAELNRITQK